MPLTLLRGFQIAQHVAPQLEGHDAVFGALGRGVWAQDGRSVHLSSTRATSMGVGGLSLLMDQVLNTLASHT